MEHLQPLLDHTKDSKLLFQVAETLAKAQVPPAVATPLGWDRFSALRLVAKTLPQQLMEDVQRATASFQYALATRAGCECIAHALQWDH